MSAANSNSVEAIIRRIDAQADGNSRLSVGDIVGELGHRSHGPFLLLPGLIGMSPLSGIPLVPAFLAVLIAVFSLQILIGRRQLWVPDILARRHIEAATVKHALNRITPVAQWMDRWFGRRLERLSGKGAVKVAALVCLALSLAVPAFEMLPFAGIAPMTAIAGFGLAILVRDGILMLAALAITTGTAVMLFQILSSL